jgi:aspartyl-tRNA(Asn)/glutamyl-tRNA(Gln) amidotransferase subunit B
MIKIGFEIHVQLNTKSKLFCNCPTNYQEVPPNTNVCPICTGQPGAKPMKVNSKALELGYLVCKALNCKLNDKVIFLRKHYFYPDLPNNYQRTSKPIGEEGIFQGIRIKEIHVEEDPGNYLLKDGLVDYNRSGLPLIEIVTHPDIKSIEEGENFLRELKFLLEYLGVIKYVFKVDVNVSLEGGERVEIKNINSIENVERALRYEILRQKRLLESGEKVIRETRHFDEERGITVSLRTKETEEDYRYVWDPDLPIFDAEHIIKNLKLPELPWEKIERLMKEYNISRTLARSIIEDHNLCNYFEKIGKHPKAKEWIQILIGELNYRNITFSEIDLKKVEEIRKLYFENKVAKHYGIELLRKVLNGEKVNIIEEKIIVDEKLIKEVINKYKKAVDDYLSGKKEAIQFLVGRVLEKTHKKADPKEVYYKVKEVLDKL